MGFFAVLRTDNSPADFVIEECHINLWSLAGILPGKRCFLWDIGLRVRAGSSPFSAVRVAIPSGTTDGGLTDLTHLLRNPETAELIFGRPVDVSSSRLENDDASADLIEVDVDASKLEASYSNPNFSVWTITLAKQVQSNGTCYFRFRLHATAIGRCWTWKNSWFERKRILIDFRISDIRELWYLGNRNSLKHSICKVEKVRFFLIVPARFRLAMASPSTFYSRILEGYAWKDYLQRLPNIFRKEKLVIHQWRHDPYVDLSRPLRIFGDLDDPRTLAFGPNLAAAIVILFFLGVAISATREAVLELMAREWHYSYTFTAKHWAALTLGGAITLLLSLGGKVEQGKKILHSIRGFLVRLERKVYRARA